MSPNSTNPEFRKWASAPPSWMEAGSDGHVVISSRVRIARNLENYPFPQNLPPELQSQIVKQIVPALNRQPEFQSAHTFPLESLRRLQKAFLVERQLISHDFAGIPGVKSLVVTPGENISVMINEEDHIRAAVFEGGFNLSEAWSKAAKLGSEFMATLPISYSRQLGFLTSCPTNVGTGLRASCLVHLPGLAATRQISTLIKTCQKAGVDFRGLYGEGSYPLGHLFQISNSRTLGDSEETILKRLQSFMESVIAAEKKAQKSLIGEPVKSKTEDILYRSLGTLERARMLDFDEGMNHLSNVRLGHLLGFEFPISLEKVTRLMFTIQPAHLKILEGETDVPHADQLRRANLINRQFQGG